MPDYSIKEITIIGGGASATNEFEAPGDYQVSVLIDYSPPKGATFRRVHAIVRDRRLAIFPWNHVAKHEYNAFPLLATVHGVGAAIENNQVYGGEGEPTGLRIEEMLNLPNVYAKAPRLKPPRLPSGQSIDPLAGPTKTRVDPDAPYAAYREPRFGLSNGQILVEGSDGQIHAADPPAGPAPDAPVDPIVRFMEMLRPMIEEMAKLTAIPVQIVPEEPEWVKRLTGGVPVTRVDIKSPTTVTEVRNVTTGGKSPADLDAAMNRAHREHRRAGPFECEVKPVDDEELQRGPGGVLDRRPPSFMRLQNTADRRERMVQIRVTDDEFREMIVWQIQQALSDSNMHDMETAIAPAAIERAAADAFRRIFSEIRTGDVITGRNVGSAP